MEVIIGPVGITVGWRYEITFTYFRIKVGKWFSKAGPHAVGQTTGNWSVSGHNYVAYI